MGATISAWTYPIDPSTLYFLCTNYGDRKYQLKPGVHPHTVLHLLGDAAAYRPPQHVLYARMQEVLVLDQADETQKHIDELVFSIATHMGGKVHSFVDRTSDPIEGRSIFFAIPHGFSMNSNHYPPSFGFLPRGGKSFSKNAPTSRDRLIVQPVSCFVFSLDPKLNPKRYCLFRCTETDGWRLLTLPLNRTLKNTAICSTSSASTDHCNALCLFFAQGKLASTTCLTSCGLWVQLLNSLVYFT